MWFFFLPHPHPSALFSLTALSFFQQENPSSSEELGKAKTLDWPNVILCGNWGKAKSINTSLLILFEHIILWRAGIGSREHIEQDFWVHSYLRSSQQGFPGGWDDEESAYNVGDPDSIPGSGRFPGEGNGNKLQYYLENLMDRGAWHHSITWRISWTEEPGIADSEMAEWLTFHFISEG